MCIFLTIFLCLSQSLGLSSLSLLSIMLLQTVFRFIASGPLSYSISSINFIIGQAISFHYFRTLDVSKQSNNEMKLKSQKNHFMML